MVSTILAKREECKTTDIPPEFRKYAKVFSDEEAQRLPKHQLWDHKIDLQPGLQMRKTSVYRLTPPEMTTLKEYITDSLKRGMLQRSKAPDACSFFFIDKKDCYDPGPGSTNFLYPPVIPTPSVTITLPANVQPTAPVIPPSFTTAIPEILIMWPTSHTHQYKYLKDPMPVVSNNSDEDSPMRTRSPSPAVEPSGSSAVVILEAREQPSPPW